MKDLLDKLSAKETLPFYAVFGASAGGVKELRTLCKNIKRNSKVIYIIVLHMSPEHPSSLVEILSRGCLLPVEFLSEKSKNLFGTVWVLPPGKTLIVNEDEIDIADSKIHAGPRPSINKILEEMAYAFGERVTGVILSGSGTDGSMGVRAVKANGGVVVVQNPELAEYKGMPESAINTGCADFILNVGDIPSELESIRNIQLETVESENNFPVLGLKKIVQILESKKGVDFSKYKSGTIIRRIAHRMRALKLNDLNDFIVVLRTDENELNSLFRSLLISVTQFFRDPDNFLNFKEQIKNYVFKIKTSDYRLRIWVAGCATGEEVYSIAFIVSELLKNTNFSFQIFASDVDEQAIRHARRGTYNIENADHQLLNKYSEFFDIRGTSLVVKSEIRDKILFSHHDLLLSPPFINIDILSCRNTLIYIRPESQDRIYQIFNYSLKTDGLLFLGRSEMVNDKLDLFEVVDLKAKIFISKNTLKKLPQISTRNPFAEHKKPILKVASVPSSEKKSEIEQQILNHFSRPSVSIDSEHKIVEIFGDLSLFSRIKSGKAENYLSNFFPDDLVAQIKSCLYMLDEKITTYQTGPIEFRTNNSETKFISILIKKWKSEVDFQNYFLVSFITFDTNPWDAVISKTSPELVENTQLKFLKEEIQLLRLKTQTLVDDLEDANSQLQTMNEELQSTNEELQSSNEELETSNEELQSTNEELTTVNEELQNKSDILNQTLHFIENIESSLESCLVILDDQNFVIRANTRAMDLFSIKQGFHTTALFSRFTDEHEKPLDFESIRSFTDYTLNFQDKIFLLRLRPYKIQSESGLILHFHDLTTIKKQEKEISQLALTKASLLDSMNSSIALVDKNSVVKDVNKLWRKFASENDSLPEYDFIGVNYLEICRQADKKLHPESHEIADGLEKVLTGKVSEVQIQYPCHSKKEQRWFLCCIYAQTDHKKNTIGAVIAHHNITEQYNYKKLYNELLAQK